MFQCHWSDVGYNKTGFLTNIRAVTHDLNFHGGWPVFSARDDAGRGRVYMGPLPPDCKHGGRHDKLIGKSAKGDFKTFASAAYPPAMCKWIAHDMFDGLFLGCADDRPPVAMQRNR